MTAKRPIQPIRDLVARWRAEIMHFEAETSEVDRNVDALRESYVLFLNGAATSDSLSPDMRHALAKTIKSGALRVEASARRLEGILSSLAGFFDGVVSAEDILTYDYPVLAVDALAECVNIFRELGCLDAALACLDRFDASVEVVFEYRLLDWTDFKRARRRLSDIIRRAEILAMAKRRSEAQDAYVNGLDKFIPTLLAGPIDDAFHATYVADLGLRLAAGASEVYLRDNNLAKAVNSYFRYIAARVEPIIRARLALDKHAVDRCLSELQRLGREASKHGLAPHEVYGWELSINLLLLAVSDIILELGYSDAARGVCDEIIESHRDNVGFHPLLTHAHYCRSRTFAAVEESALDSLDAITFFAPNGGSLILAVAQAFVAQGRLSQGRAAAALDAAETSITTMQMLSDQGSSLPDWAKFVPQIARAGAFVVLGRKIEAYQAFEALGAEQQQMAEGRSESTAGEAMDDFNRLFVSLWWAMCLKVFNDQRGAALLRHLGESCSSSGDERIRWVAEVAGQGLTPPNGVLPRPFLWPPPRFPGPGSLEAHFRALLEIVTA